MSPKSSRKNGWRRKPALHGYLGYATVGLMQQQVCSFFNSNPLYEFVRVFPNQAFEDSMEMKR
ncbi:hypothetical protein XYCOK13_32960 [Xylanibacillus composti]|uniref:Uncharacterized protein n=1 Tax=Xylanibacillus composti TaxID=1572762 RepID=A0A8J4H3S7_9BACL|nr:hypothetical protein XYCOK13_32960 [Xylanibacillus composti]